MADVARAAHLAARVYGSLDAALDMTPRQLGAAAALEAERRSAELQDLFYVAQVAAHGNEKEVDMFLKDLRS